MADIDITITIPDAWISRVQDALTNQASKSIGIEFENAHKRYSYEPKGTDTWVQFAERAFKAHLINQIKVSELSVSYANYTEAINGIEQPFEDVPEDILT